MQETVPKVDIARGWPYFVALFALTFLAFWPSYFSLGLGQSSVYIHFHAATAALWMSLLILQPWLIRTYRYDLHRITGRVSYALVPLVIVSMILLANFRIRTVGENDYAIQTFVLYLQVSLASLFALSYVFAMLYRRKPELHARFMVCTALTLIDPILARLLFWANWPPPEYHQWITYGSTDLLLLALIFIDRRQTSGGWVFRLMLPVFILFQLPALLWLTNSEIWQSFARWFQSVPLT